MVIRLALFLPLLFFRSVDMIAFLIPFPSLDPAEGGGEVDEEDEDFEGSGWENCLGSVADFCAVWLMVAER